MMVCI